jgi:AbrB family looped-hinge helix DNA binding protein
MKITSKGQVTIPQEIREKFGFLPHTEVEFIVEDDKVRLVKKKTVHAFGKKVVNHMRGRGTVEMSTDEIMSLTRGD